MKNVLITVLALLVVNTLTAQDDLPSGQVDVVKSFEARLAEANRIDVSPVLPPLDTVNRRLEYNVISKEVPVEYLPPRIRPLAFRTEQPATIYNGFAKFGLGLPRAFYGEISYDITKEETFDFGINLRRHTANNTNNVENQRFSNNRLELDGTYYFPQGFAVNGSVGYTTDGVYYYGYNDVNEELDTTLYSFDDLQVRQRFNILDFGFGIFNGERTQADFNYSARADIYAMTDEYAARENAFKLDLSATKWFDERHPLVVQLITDFSTFRDTAKQNLNNFFLKPSYTYHANAFNVKVGANIASSDDEFFFFPDIEANANIIPGVVTAFAGINGDLTKNNMRSLLEYNPFLRTRFRLSNSNWTDFYGGVKGNAYGVTYQGKISYRRVEDLALFQMNDPLAVEGIYRFGVLYDTASITAFNLTVSVPILDMIDLTGSFQQQVFSLDNEEKPWHLPSTTLSAGAAYTALEDKLRVRADLFVENGVPYRTPEGVADNLNGLLDLSFGAEYQVVEQFGLWVQLNNVLNNRRQRWFRYPILGLNVLVGASARF
ncbi:MAG: hypothetical protein AAGJ82_08035 [Bacteroidota bacterium]